MDISIKNAILEFLFPISSMGVITYDEDRRYAIIEEQYLLASSLLDNITREEINNWERNALDFSIFMDADDKKILNDAKWLLNYLRSGNKLSGYFFELSRLFAPKQLRKRLYILTYIYFKGKPCNNEDRLVKLVDHYTVINILNRVYEIWNMHKMPIGVSLLEKFYFLKQVNLCAKEAIQDYKKGNSVIDYLLSRKLI